jgi:hypothetical protein
VQVRDPRALWPPRRGRLFHKVNHGLLPLTLWRSVAVEMVGQTVADLALDVPDVLLLWLGRVCNGEDCRGSESS